MLVGAGFGCATARNYLDPDQPIYEGSHTPPTQAAAAGRSEFRIVTFNIKEGQRVEAAIAFLRDRPELARADVLLLQEMQAPGVEAVARTLNLNYVYYPASHHTKSERDIGNAILSPWPIEERWKVVLPHLSRLSRHARSAVAAKLRIDGRPLRVYCLHLGTPINLSGPQRREQLAAIVDDARGSADPVLVGGDFNSKSMAEWLSEQGYAWPTRDVGKTTTLLRYSFDHLLVRGLEPPPGSNAGVVRNSDGISDHYPVWATFRWITP